VESSPGESRGKENTEKQGSAGLRGPTDGRLTRPAYKPESRSRSAILAFQRRGWDSNPRDPKTGPSGFQDR